MPELLLLNPYVSSDDYIEKNKPANKLTNEEEEFVNNLTEKEKESLFKFEIELKWS